MKPLWRHILAAAVVLACCAVWILSAGSSRAHRRTVTCQSGVDVVVADSAERRFVCKEDVEDWLEKDYHAYVGLPLDSVDLDRVERIVDSRSAVRKSQAWISDDGVIHISLTQRQPVIRFQKADNGWYADATGYLFPLQSRHTVRVPVVDGDIPISVPRGFKGMVEDGDQRIWLERVLALAAFLEKDRIWAENIGQIHAEKNGELTLVPRKGRELFLFGQPERIPEKFDLIRNYYQSIAPARDSGYYRTVDVRYEKQIVCRQK